MKIEKANMDEPYTIILNRASNDKRISFKAFGMLCHLLSKPADWNVFISELASQGREGKAAITTGMQELIDAGYVEKKRCRNPDGSFQAVEYFVYPTPREKEAKKPTTQKRLSEVDTAKTATSDFTTSDNRPLQKKDLNKTKIKQQLPREREATPEKQSQEPETPSVVPVSDSTLGYNATAEDRSRLNLPNENKKQPLPQNQRMQIEDWMGLWRKYMKKHWPAGQNMRAVHILRYWTRPEIEEAFAQLPKADYPGWAYLKSIFENQAGDHPVTGKDRELELFLSEQRVPTTKIDDISKYL